MVSTSSLAPRESVSNVQNSDKDTSNPGTMHAKCCHSKGKKVHHFRLIFNGGRNLTLSSSEIKKNGMQAASSQRVPRVANGCVSNLVTSFLEDLPGSEKLIGGAQTM
ncbi:hypothetical protein RHMOL_Rhmol10G0008900 [Rhododendron molle]|uniref:Uncharacterized protein n=1 Tax=Rhododendron molle TaxID=49168 RepID=A0ACC0LXH5_RHOML|nr:hypothetical protein RHMOL_Rhmol10G0008900 [Rhododendron molle]